MSDTGQMGKIAAGMFDILKDQSLEHAAWDKDKESVLSWGKVTNFQDWVNGLMAIAYRRGFSAGLKAAREGK